MTNKRDCVIYSNVFFCLAQDRNISIDVCNDLKKARNIYEYQGQLLFSQMNTIIFLDYIVKVWDGIESSNYALFHITSFLVLSLTPPHTTAFPSLTMTYITFFSFVFHWHILYTFHITSFLVFSVSLSHITAIPSLSPHSHHTHSLPPLTTHWHFPSSPLTYITPIGISLPLPSHPLAFSFLSPHSHHTHSLPPLTTHWHFPSSPLTYITPIGIFLPLLSLTSPHTLAIPSLPSLFSKL